MFRSMHPNCEKFVKDDLWKSFNTMTLDNVAEDDLLAIGMLASERLFQKSGMVVRPDRMWLPKMHGRSVEIKKRFEKRAPRNDVPAMLNPFVTSYGNSKTDIDLKDVEDNHCIATFICKIHAYEFVARGTNEKVTNVELLWQEAYLYDFKKEGVLPVGPLKHKVRDNTPPPTPDKAKRRRMWSDLDD